MTISACEECTSLRTALAASQEKVRELEDRLARETQDTFAARELLEDFMRAADEQRPTAQAELAAESTRLAATLDAREAQIRVLQFALEQRVRATLHGPVTCELSGPATLDYPTLEAPDAPGPRLRPAALAPATDGLTNAEDDEGCDMWSASRTATPPPSHGAIYTAGSNRHVAHPLAVDDPGEGAADDADLELWAILDARAVISVPTRPSGPPSSSDASWSAIEPPSEPSSKRSRRSRPRRQGRG